MNSTFNLWDEPWIAVLTTEGSTDLLSLSEVFAQAATIKGIRSDLPTQDAAIFRLLLAILHRSLSDRPADSTWEAMWKSGELDLAAVSAYALRWRHRFDLIDPEVPFLQVADLRTPSGSVNHLNKLVQDAPTKEQFFTVRHADVLNRTSLDEAARYLLAGHAFDIAGLHPASTEDVRARPNNCTPGIGPGWVGWLGLIILEGANLLQSLLLNLALTHNPDDSAVWERDPLRGTTERDEGGGERALAGPRGIADLLTWPSRRIRLFYRDGYVYGALVCNGDKLHPANQNRYELMTAWRRSSTQERLLGLAQVMMPLGHETDRSFWRGLGAVISTEVAGGKTLRPGTFENLARFQDLGVLDQRVPIRAHAIGVSYSKDYSAVREVYDDSITFNSDLVSSPELQAEVTKALEDADHAVSALVHLERNLIAASGGEPNRSQSGGEAYELLGQSFREWLRALTSQSDLLQARQRWQDCVARVVVGQAHHLLDQAGMPAWIGRSITDSRSSKSRLVNSSIAEKWFYQELAKSLPHRTHPEESHVS